MEGVFSNKRGAGQTGAAAIAVGGAETAAEADGSDTSDGEEERS